MATFCTISTFSHLYKAFALAESLSKFNGELKVLLIDSDEIIEFDTIPKNVEINFLKSLNSDRAKQTIKKYKNDKLRWSLKPVYLQFLLNSYKKVIYVDNDIYFYKDFRILFEELKKSNIILTPHFYPASPKNDQTWLEANFRIGLYNAGFVGVNRNAISALEWWSDCCLYEIKKSYWRGLFDDQKYLDLFPILFENVKIIKDRGCNFAGWNSNSNIDLNQIVFVHFNSFTLQKFKKEDNIYYPLFNLYKEQLKLLNPKFEEKRRGLSLFKFNNGLYFLKWKFVRFITKNIIRLKK